MICKNCRGGLRPLGGNPWLICTDCGLIHNEHGDDLGWPVVVEGVPGGLIPRSDIEAVMTERPLQTMDVSFAIRAAAAVGFKYLDEVKKLIRDEELGDVMDHIRNHGVGCLREV